MSSIRLMIGLFVVALLFLPDVVRATDGSIPTNPVSFLRITIGQSLTPEEENRMAEVEGVVTFAGKQGRSAYLEIGSAAGNMPINIAQGDSRVDILLKSRIRVRGICSNVWSSAGGEVPGLQVATMNDIAVLQMPEEVWQRFRLDKVGVLASTNLLEPVVRLRGKVESIRPGQSFLLADESGEATLNSKEAMPEMEGMEIEVLCGWQQMGLDRVFQAGVFRSLTAATPT